MKYEAFWIPLGLQLATEDNKAIILQIVLELDNKGNVAVLEEITFLPSEVDRVIGILRRKFKSAKHPAFVEVYDQAIQALHLDSVLDQISRATKEKL